MARTYEQEQGEITPDYRTALFDAAPEPIQLLDVHGTILLANQAAQVLRDGLRSNLAERSFTELIALEHHAALRAALAAAAGGKACQLELKSRDGDDAGIWLDARFGPLAESQPGLVVMTCHDITVARRRDIKLNGQADILRAIADELVAGQTEALSKTASEQIGEPPHQDHIEALAHSHKIDTLGQLTAGLAHDFNNLLVAIMGGFQLIDAHLQDEAVQQLTRNGMQAAERAASLVRQLLAVARREPPRPEIVNLAEAIPAMRDLLRYALNPRHALNITVPEEVWPVMVDAPQLETALLNLAVNARDAMGERGTLTITVANVSAGSAAGVHGDHVIITVADTGAGIPAHLQQRVSEPFFTTKPRGAGTGLGLTMVKNFADASGGDIDIESSAAEGTKIHLRLPRAPGQALASAMPEETVKRQTCVLVVEDQDAVRPITSALLRDAGYRVVEAADSAVALAIMQVGGEIDVLVTNVHARSMDGPRLVRAVRCVRPGLPAILVASHDDGNGLAPDIVVKTPFDGADLTHAISLALAGSAVRGAAPRPGG